MSAESESLGHVRGAGRPALRGRPWRPREEAARGHAHQPCKHGPWGRRKSHAPLHLRDRLQMRASAPT